MANGIDLLLPRVSGISLVLLGGFWIMGVERRLLVGGIGVNGSIVAPSTAEAVVFGDQEGRRGRSSVGGCMGGGAGRRCRVVLLLFLVAFQTVISPRIYLFMLPGWQSVRVFVVCLAVLGFFSHMRLERRMCMSRVWI